MQECAVHFLTKSKACPSASRVGSPRQVDAAGVKAHRVCSTSSPLDQPQGLRRGFVFQGRLHAA